MSTYNLSPVMLCLKWTGCSSTFISSSYLCHCMWALVLWWAMLVYLFFSLIPSHLCLYRCCLADFLMSAFLRRPFFVWFSLKDATAVRVSQSPTWLIYYCSACKLPPPLQFFLCCPGNTKVNTEFTFLHSFSFPAIRSYKFSSLFLIQLK